MGSATVYSVDPTSGNFSTEFEGLPYTDSSFLDSGSNGLFFDPTNTDLANDECADLQDEYYCPSSPEAFSATNEGSNGTSSQVNFTVANADSFYDNAAEYGVDGVFNGWAGPFSGVFDWGLPFFYGLNVYTAIDGQNTPAGAGPYVAY